MREAIAMAVENVRTGRGGPFAALVVRDGEVVGRGTNRVTTTHDPTAHAEIVALREACRRLGVFHLTGCELYTSCEPCPMCLGAAYWARLERIYYAATRREAEAVGFIDAQLYEELCRAPGERRLPMVPLLAEEGRRPFEAWQACENRVDY